ncbi:MAG: GFA family protein [Pseudomonadota bacterium]
MSVATGGCSCGAIRFAAAGDPLRVGVCHCLDCRKHHGTPFYAAAIFASTAVTLEGTPRFHEGRAFCPRCGSSVYAVSGEEIELHLGAMDEPGRFKPQYELWTTRREPWLRPIEGAEQFDKDR